jgi:serine/threonine protein kinase
VWLAERCDGTFNRRVALKLPHAYLGDTLRQRFDRERDILADLHHPHIAQLYDAGIGDGQPFLAMELIEGIPITQFCREGCLPLAPRLALFGQVLGAVDYAHARFIAHRDLKPANILVTAGGEVKLLDFGIAKLLSGPGEPGADLTEFGGRAATPAYAAPEQVAGLPVTTAVDIYAAGVVLYELLVGVRPFGTAVKHGRADAPLASRRVSDDEALLVGGKDGRSLRRELQGDLDAILAKALEEDPERRYRTATAFAADLQASRELRPIAARHLGHLAFAARFIRRHRTASAFSALLLVTLLAGGVGVSVEAERARAAAERERQAAARAEQEAVHAETEAKRQRVIRTS